MSRRRVAAECLVVLLILPGVVACSGGGTVTASFDGGHGTVNVFLTDAPVDLMNARSVQVTLTGVILYPEDGTTGATPLGAEATGGEGSPIVLMSRPATFDLLTLTGGATALVATEEVPAGRYSRIRLQISDASLQIGESAPTPLRIESRKVDIPIHFRVSPNAETGITLDFDAAASVQVSRDGTGEYILRPVVTPKAGSS
jgi:uncharacterized protein DUF4382